MKSSVILLAACLLSSAAAMAQTTPSTTQSTNTVGLGGTVSGSTGTGNTGSGTPTRYDNRNSGMPSESQVKMKAPKPAKMKRNGKMKSAM